MTQRWPCEIFEEDVVVAQVDVTVSIEICVQGSELANHSAQWRKVTNIRVIRNTIVIDVEVARIARTILVEVGLIRVRKIHTVVEGVSDSLVIDIDLPGKALQEEQRIVAHDNPEEQEKMIHETGIGWDPGGFVRRDTY